MQWLRRFAVRVLQETCLEALRGYQAQVKRLETQLLQNTTDLEALQASHLSFMRKSVGRLGGRPRAPGAEIDTADLDSIPKGDKAALRQHFAGEIAARSRKT